MAWTTPASASANAVYTSAFYNSNTRDNLNASPNALVTQAGDGVWATGPNALVRVPLMVYKSADETVNNSTTLQNDDHLLLPLGANEIWSYQMKVFFTNASGTPGLKWAFTVPAGATGIWECSIAVGADFTSLVYGTNIFTFATTTITTGVSVLNGVTFATGFINIDGFVVNSTTPGNLQFQWAQASGVVANTIAKKGSYMIPTRLA